MECRICNWLSMQMELLQLFGMTGPEKSCGPGIRKRIGSLLQRLAGTGGPQPLLSHYHWSGRFVRQGKEKSEYSGTGCFPVRIRRCAAFIQPIPVLMRKLRLRAITITFPGIIRSFSSNGLSFCNEFIPFFQRGIYIFQQFPVPFIE